MSEAAPQLLWMVESAAGTPLGPILASCMPQGTVLAPVSLGAPWRGPSGHRPVAVVVGVPAGESHAGVRTVEQACDRTHLPVMVLFERPSADLRHAVLLAGAVATLTLSASDPEQKRLRRQLRSSLALFLEGPASTALPDRSTVRLIVVGSSTGGPDTLARIFAGQVPFEAPLVIGQHLLEGYDASLASFLGDRGLACEVAREGDRLEPGRVFLAPAGHDLLVRDGSLHLEPARGQYVPNVDALFESAAVSFGRSAVGVLLTGMGDDGAQGLLALHQAGAFTIAQAGETCVVDGMPAAARALGAQSVDWPPSEIRNFVTTLRRPTLAG